VALEAWFVNFPTLRSWTAVNVTATSSPLLAVIAGGSARAVWVGDSLILDGGATVFRSFWPS
jgi:hypothetical protein